MENEDAFKIREPFTPKVVLTKVYGMVSIDVGTGLHSERSEPCLVCNEQISEGLDVVLDNGQDDKMQVGYCCSEHPKQAIAVNAFARAAELLRARTAAIQKLADVANAGKIEIVE